MNCVLYARVSTEQQADRDLSIPAQLEAMRNHARQHGWLIVAEFIEPGVSARTAARPELQRLLAMVRDRDATVGVVLVHKIDRLARNVADHATIRALLKQRDIRLVSVVENVDDSVSGQLVENIMASIAQFYSANLGEEVKKGMRQRVMAGGWPHLAPAGYVQVKEAGAAGSRVEIHPRLGPLVAEAFDLYASGVYSVKSLASRLAKDGWTSRSGGPIAPSHLRRILTNPFYSGRIRWKDLDVPGKHRALTSPEVFAKVQGLMSSRYRQRGRGNLRGVPLRGLAICASCRGHMTAERHERWLYYRCSRQAYRRDRCPARFCNAEHAHRDLKRICLQVQITRATASAIAKSARNLLAARAADTARLESECHEQNAALFNHESRLTEAFAAGDLSAEAYAAKTSQLTQDRQRLTSKEKRIQRDPKETLAEVRRLLDLATCLWDLYEPLADDKRTELLRLTFATITLGPSGIVGYSLTPSIKTIVASEGGTETRAAALLELMDAA